MLAFTLAVLAAALILRVLYRRRSEKRVVAYVCDGDSLICEDGSRIRLLSIDAPEMEQVPAGRAAREALMELIPPGTAIRLRPGRRAVDRYGRRLAYVLTPAGGSVSLAMVRSGYALANVHPGEGSVHALRIVAAALLARLNRKGLWASGGFVIPPDRFRRSRDQSPRISPVEVHG